MDLQLGNGIEDRSILRCRVEKASITLKRLGTLIITVILQSTEMEMRMLLETRGKVPENLAELISVGWKEDVVSNKIGYLAE